MQCEICLEYVHIKCNKYDKNDLNYFDKNWVPFYCINCIGVNIPFSTLGENQYKLSVIKGVNYIEENEIQIEPNDSHKLLFEKLNMMSNNLTDDDNDDDEFGNIVSKCKYFSLDDFKLERFVSGKNFSIFHLNIHSIEAHIHELRTLLILLEFQFDFICISESKLSKNNNPQLDISIEGYQSPIGTPTESTKGGVLIYVKSGISVKPRPDLNNLMYRSKELESFFVETIDPREKSSVIGVVYRHPCMYQNVFNDDYLKPLLDVLRSENKNFYIPGDFNYDLLKVSSHAETSDFFDSMMSNLLLPTITLPTKINRDSNTIIDNIFTNNIHPDMKSGNFTVGISDHLASFLIIPRKNQNHAPNKQNLFRRSMKNFDKANFVLDYLEIDWGDILEIDKQDPNVSIKNFNDKMNMLLDKHMPLKKVSQKEFKRKLKPWISNEIMGKMREKNHTFRKYLRCKDPPRKAKIYEHYKFLRNNLNNSLHLSKKSFYERYFSRNKDNLKKVWKGIREIVNIKSKNFDEPCCIQKGDETLSNPKPIANEFNNYFTSIADDILKNNKYEGNKTFREYLDVSIMNSFVLFECDESEIRNIINDFDLKKASGPNSIPPQILHLLKNEIPKPLSMIFNLSFATGIHPEILRIAKTIPVFKKGSRLLVSNYRPISLLSNINKIIEKLVYSRLYKFLNDNKCFYDFQFGFRAKHSVNHALIDITEKIRNALDNHKFACGVFVDFQKAFDTVNHKILIDKLKYYGVRGIANSWFSSYLSNRSQFVSILGFDSETKFLKHGVPQGSVLGPLLFLIFINDLNKCIKYSKVYHFADDTNLLNISDNPKQIQKQMNIDLKLLYKWLLANKISLNCSKTEIIFFRKPGQKINFNFNIKINGHKIFPSDYIKYLGIYLDFDLTGKQQSCVLIKKLNRSNGMLSKARHYIPADELKSLYYAIFSSHMSYGCQVWHNNNVHSEKIEKAQNKAMRIISFADYHAPVEPLFKEKHIIRINDFIALQNILFVHDCFHNKLPSCFNDYFTLVSDVHDHNTFSNEMGMLYAPEVNTTMYGLHSLSKKCVASWNFYTRKLSSNLKNLSRAQLKKNISQYMIDQY